MRIIRHYFSSPRASFYVETKNNIVIETAPIAKRFIGQHVDKLKKWFDIDMNKEILAGLNENNTG